LTLSSSLPLVCSGFRKQDNRAAKVDADSKLQEDSIERVEEAKQEEDNAYSKKDEPYRTRGTRVYYPAKYVHPDTARENGHEPPMEVGNADNMDSKLKDLGIDFEGIWWMSDNPVPEELVSFANTVVKATNGGFPATLMVPNSRKGMWSWLTTSVGNILRRYYATGDPDSHTDFVFTSPLEGEITTGLTDVPIVWVERFPFYKYTKNCAEFAGDKFLCDPTDCAENIPDKTCADLIEEYPDDMWSRPTIFQERSWFSNTTYTLKRIVLGDGSKHPVFWDEFMTHMEKKEKDCSRWERFWGKCRTGKGEKEMQSYRSDNWCKRKHDAIWGRLGGYLGCE